MILGLLLLGPASSIFLFYSCTHHCGLPRCMTEDALITFWQTERLFVGPYLSTSALQMYICLVPILGGSSTGGCGARSSVLSRIILNTHICNHLEIPQCSIHLAHKIRVASLVFRNLMTCPHWFGSLWRLDNESSRSWYDPRNHSILMQRLQLAPEIVCLSDHPHNLFSELHHLVAVTPVLDQLIRCLLS